MVVDTDETDVEGGGDQPGQVRPCFMNSESGIMRTMRTFHLPMRKMKVPIGLSSAFSIAFGSSLDDGIIYDIVSSGFQLSIGT